MAPARSMEGFWIMPKVGLPLGEAARRLEEEAATRSQNHVKKEGSEKFGYAV